MARTCTLLLFYIVLVYLAVEDFRKRKISNWCHAAILLLALISLATIPEISWISQVMGMFVVSVPMAFLDLSLPGSFGGGDVKLTFACGAFLGWQLLLDGTLIAVFLAGLYCLWLMVVKHEKGKAQFAFGPFLSIGYILEAFELFYIL